MRTKIVRKIFITVGMFGGSLPRWSPLEYLGPDRPERPVNLGEQQ